MRQCNYWSFIQKSKLSRSKSTRKKIYKIPGRNALLHIKNTVRKKKNLKAWYTSFKTEKNTTVKKANKIVKKGMQIVTKSQEIASHWGIQKNRKAKCQDTSITSKRKNPSIERSEWAVTGIQKGAQLDTLKSHGRPPYWVALGGSNSAGWGTARRDQLPVGDRDMQSRTDIRNLKKTSGGV